MVEPSGAAALAAVMKQKIKKCGDEQNLVIILTGGNVSVDDLCKHKEKVWKEEGNHQRSTKNQLNSDSLG